MHSANLSSVVNADSRLRPAEQQDQPINMTAALEALYH
jgi:hypothetical protein